MSIKSTPYKHLLPEDTPVWKRFLAKYSSMFHRIDYDVHVGEGRHVLEHHPEYIKRMAKGLSERRIDAVGFTAAGIYIIEITRYAGLKAVGQMQTYELLYRMKFDTKQKIFKLLVCEQLGTDILPVLMEQNIDYITLPEVS